MTIIYSEDQLPEVAEEILRNIPTKTVAFYGEMGAGKTTLIKEIAKKLDVIDGTNSPTFGIVNEYENNIGELIAYHFDFYRLNDENEALDFGLEDYFNKNVWVFMEWPEKIPSYLPENTTSIKIEIVDSTNRKLQM
ncbi:tRNA (adenosine(37)-N6)-threonylcarbamoyltransferase complex ATPase subunit type 1 TsaE [uncultured Maribacter sp.]|uniref:tRNA (adenosine(37)-N6)-threonylcarbamoyltransferase complex ATPase subunit type 1 TsaE n=1 Tax=uncultured Maribacter sp. TaxID=431308 RepID=UPI0026062443|nr:tRNA (adenosine(37)-N6)-threonylcarbamoyltransferase complex ATPase subunit type 1 TsaE [uncultured Maribacter sp.]